ncbi:hypothetical protein [Acidisoma sp. S159]|uniref:hypothetical protein n=1 Tax=Acidisoma sp. S159 TaxID=1747225 RepID=UPI00131BC1C4|nr:hypothetical protein [Acidisoma sp. S159]
MSIAELNRREKLVQEDSNPSPDGSAFVTGVSIKLTEKRPCARVSAEAILSGDWRWTRQAIPANESLYFQVAGVLRDGVLDTVFDNDGDPFEKAAARSELNASVTGNINRAQKLSEGQ